MVAASATTTSDKAEPDRDVAVEALNHLVQGKRHLVVQDITSAVNSLAEACRLLDACYGQMADECGDAYYNYGVALLELSRRGPGLLTNGKDGPGSEHEDGDDEDEDGDNENEDEDDDKDDDEKEEGSESDDDDSKTNDSEAKSENLEESEAADEQKEDKALDVPSTSGDKTSETPSLVTTSVPPTSSSAKPEPMPIEEIAGTSSGAEKPAEDDEPSNLQLAWEVLEVAKIIFKRQLEKNPDVMPSLARVHSKLGEVSMESENYQQSIDDLLECLAMQKSCLSAEDRSIAETYYHIGLAYSFDLQFENSITNFNNAIQVLKDRIVNFEKNLGNNVDKVEEKDSTGTQKEIDELKVLISDIHEKIADTDDLRKNTVKLPEALYEKPVIPSPQKEKPESLGEVDSTTPSLNIVKPAFNINHLVRKKRKNEDSEVSTSDADVVDTKRPRAEIGEAIGDGNVVQPDNSTSTGSIIAMEDNVGPVINGSGDFIATST